MVNVYKSFDSSHFLFETIWKHFPTIRTFVDGDKIINKLIITSNEFCDLRNKNMFNLKYFSEGGFGKVGTIGLKTTNNNNLESDKSKIKAAIFSINQSYDQNNIFYTDIIIKIGINQTKAIIHKTHDSSISITDPLSDMIFGSVLSHLFDIGVCPFVTKYFGTYLCTNNETSMIIEASNYELRKKLSRYDKDRLEIKEFKNVIIQFMYALYILKIYFGTVHFDSHLRNIMLTDVRDTEYMYHGKFFKDIKYIILETGLKDPNGNAILIVIPNSKYIVKLIDYGCMLFCFDRSIFDRFRKDLRIETDNKNINAIGALNALNMSKINKSYANTVDFMFSIINIYEYLAKGLDQGYKGDITAKSENLEYLNFINSIMFNIIGISMEEFLNKNPIFQIQKTNNDNYDWFMRNHNCGFPSNFENPKYLIDVIIKLCIEDVFMDYFPFENTKYYEKTVHLYCTEKLTTNISSDNSLFLTCNISDYTKMFNRFEKIIDYENKCKYNPQYCVIPKINNQNPFETFIPGKKYNIIETPAYKISKVLMNTFNFDAKYRKYNTWLGYKPIPKYLINNDLQEIILFFIRFKNKNITNSNVKLEFTDNITTTSGIKLPLTYSKINSKNILEPMGFFANRIPTKLANNQYPNDYNNFLAMLLMDSENGMVLEKYSDFIDRHETNNNIVTFPITLKYGNKYNWAVNIGPILIWNKELIFTEENIKNQNLSNLFANNFKGPFFMNGAIEIESQLVYIVKQGFSGFLFIEGNGYLSNGLDKFSTARLCKYLDFDFAISVMSGPYTNIICKTQDSDIWLSKIFNERTHSVVLDILPS